jgi:hypothetical protein
MPSKKTARGKEEKYTLVADKDLTEALKRFGLEGLELEVTEVNGKKTQVIPRFPSFPQGTSCFPFTSACPLTGFTRKGS